MVVLYCVVVFLEINRVRVNLFQLGTKEPVPLPEAAGPNIQLTEKLYVPVKDHPEVCISLNIMIFLFIKIIPGIICNLYTPKKVAWQISCKIPSLLGDELTCPSTLTF